jgi:hypothetical protein
VLHGALVKAEARQRIGRALRRRCVNATVGGELDNEEGEVALEVAPPRIW